MLVGKEEGTTDKVTTTPFLNNTTSAVIPETTVTVESSSNTTALNDTNPPEPEVTTYCNIITAGGDCIIIQIVMCNDILVFYFNLDESIRVIEEH